MNKIIHGDSGKILKTFEENSVDMVCTDFPYAIEFMGKSWDKALPSVELLSEILRVMKPGAWLFTTFTPRQDCLSRILVRLEDAGFNTSFTSLYWCYASGFPKAENIAKFIEKRNREPDEIEEVKGCGGMTNDKGYNTTKHHHKYNEYKTPEAETFDGWFGGFQPKPAVEIIIVAQKRFPSKTFVDQALLSLEDDGQASGSVNFGECRIPYQSEADKEDATPTSRSITKGWKWEIGQTEEVIPHPNGRFPANLLVEGDVLNDGKDRLSKWGKQSTFDKNPFTPGNNEYVKIDAESPFKNDSGSFSRYFSLDAWFADRIKKLPEEVQKVFPMLLCPKPSPNEKSRGLSTQYKIKEDVSEEKKYCEEDRVANNHPT